MDIDLQTLNEKYAIPGQVVFVRGPGGLTMAVVNNTHAQASMTLAGGHLMTYQIHGGQPLLWVSPNASYIPGKAMRGGIPICWPWFGAHPEDPQGKPMHGLVRTMLWSVVGTRALPDGSTELRMRVSDTPETLAVWPHPFELEVIATFGPRLRIEWVARNPGSLPYQYTGAFHPYFPVGDVGSVSIYGLEGLDYLDKVQDFQRQTQPGVVKINGLTDRIYLDTTSEVGIEDPILHRRIHIAKQNSRTTVVWNPDVQDEKMADVGQGQHRYFVCVEAANAVNDIVTVPPGGEGRLAMEVWA